MKRDNNQLNLIDLQGKSRQKNFFNTTTFNTEESDDASLAEDKLLAATSATGRIPVSKTTKYGTVTHYRDNLVSQSMKIRQNNFTTTVN